MPGSNESDLRTLYCAFAISYMLNDWSGVDIPRAIDFISSCRVCEFPSRETLPNLFCRLMKGDMARHHSAKRKVRSYFLCSDYHNEVFRKGGTTYTAIAALYLAPRNSRSLPLTPAEHQATIHWLLQRQDKSGGFCGRTNKEADACYCFWCGASLQVYN